MTDKEQIYEKLGKYRQYMDEYSGGRLRIQLTPERFGVVWKDIVVGSEPAPRFYIMVVVSTLIAGFGLVADSVAVVIGAMLVAPLMTPIFGISMGLVRGNTRLLKRALKSELAGVFLAILMGLLVGWVLTLVDPTIQATGEMLARTKPNLFDLLVAILAGFAGAYAILDENISPALPGVAIATAIVPPLVNCGLCLAYGALYGALGSFLLFSANFLSIHLVGALLFYRAGMGRDYGDENKTVIVRRFGFTFACFLCIAVVLSYFLYNIMVERYVRSTVRSALVTALSDHAVTGIDQLVVRENSGRVHVLARIYSTSRFRPTQVRSIEQAVADRVGKPTDLVIREIMSEDVSSTGSNNVISRQGLDGFFLSHESGARIQLVRTAEQALLEKIDEFVGLELRNVKYLPLQDQPTVFALIGGVHKPSPEDLAAMEALVRERTDTPGLRLLVRFVNEEMMTKDGPARYAWFTLIKPSAHQIQARDRMTAAIRAAFASDEQLLLTHINSVVEESGYLFLVEVEGPGTYARDRLAALEAQLTAMAGGQPVTCNVWLNHGVVMTRAGLVSYDALLNERAKSFNVEAKETIRRLLEKTR